MIKTSFKSNKPDLIDNLFLDMIDHGNIPFNVEQSSEKISVYSDADSNGEFLEFIESKFGINKNDLIISIQTL